MFSPAIITSRLAQDDLEKIRGEHDSLVRGLAAHQARIMGENQRKSQELASENAMKSEMEKAKMVSDTEVKKASIAADMKRAELEIKRAALSAM